MAKSIIGIDIGSRSVKAVEIEKKRNGSFLHAVGEISIPPNLSAAISEEGLVTLAGYIRQLIKDIDIKTKKTVAAFPSEKALINIIDLPLMPESELSDAMRWQIPKYVPKYPEEKAAFWDILDKNDRGFKVLIVAADRILINKYLGLVKESKLDPVSLEIEPVALIRSLAQGDLKDSILVDFGSTFTSCSLVESGKLDLSRSLKVGVDKLIEAISGSGDKEQASRDLFEFGLLRFKNKEIYKAIAPYINQITSELKRLVTYYEEKTKKELKKIILAGGGAMIPDIDNFLIKEISRDVILANPWQHLSIAPHIDSEELVSMGPSFAVAVGLAMVDL